MASEKKPKPARFSVLGNHLRVAAFIIIPLFYIFLLILPSVHTPVSTPKLLYGYQLGWVYAFCVTGTLWLSNIIPIPVIGFVPLVILPLVGISTSKKLADAFMTNVNMTTFGSLIFVLAIDGTGLRERMSLRLLKHSSGSYRWIFIYTFVITGLLSMWMNAAAATFLMIEPFEKEAEAPESTPMEGEKIESTGNEMMVKPMLEQGTPEDEVKVFETQNQQLLEVFGSELLYAIAVAANICGTLWPYCSPMGAELLSNTVAISFKTNQVFGWTQASWMTYSFPLILINSSIALSFLVWVNFSKSQTMKNIFKTSGERLCNCVQDSTTLQRLRNTFSGKHADLPPFSFAELATLFLSALMIVLYLTRLPVFMTGWLELFYNRIDLKSKKDDRLDVGDAMGMIVIVFLAFVIPGVGCKLFKGPTAPTDKPKFAGLVVWKSVQTKFPWGIIMVIGGSSCLAKFSEKTVAVPIASYIFNSVGSATSGVLQVQFMLIILTVFASHVMSNPGTSILMITVWKNLLTRFTDAKRFEFKGALILPIYSMASLCFIVPSSSIPTGLVYLNNKNDKLSAFYFLRMGIPLFLITSIPTVLYALLNYPDSLTVTM